jgi:hypothetical protein
MTNEAIFNSQKNNDTKGYNQLEKQLNLLHCLKNFGFIGGEGGLLRADALGGGGQLKCDSSSELA